MRRAESTARAIISNLYGALMSSSVFKAAGGGGGASLKPASSPGTGDAGGDDIYEEDFEEDEEEEEEELEDGGVLVMVGSPRKSAVGSPGVPMLPVATAPPPAPAPLSASDFEGLELDALGHKMDAFISALVARLEWGQRQVCLGGGVEGGE